MTRSFWQEAHRSREATYDVVVVGGGIIGCSTAYWLHRRTAGRVAIVEARTLGAAASGRNAGFILQGTDTDYLSDIERYGERTARSLWHFTLANRELMASELNGSAFGWAPQGSLTVAGSADEDERLQASVPKLRAAGAPVVYLSPEETNARLHGTGFHGSLYVTSGAVVDPLHLVRHVAAQSQADVFPHHPVRRITWPEGAVVLHTPDRRFRARRVVLALGPYLPTLVPELGAAVRPVRAQMLATAPAEDRALPVPAYSHDGHYYIRQLPRGDVLVGGGRHRHRSAEQGYEDRTTPAVQNTIERYLHTYFPWTRSLSIRQRWSGTMGFSPDGRPVVGTVPGRPRGLFATGFTGHGMSYGFRMGRLLADLLCDDPPPASLSLFNAGRLAEADGMIRPTGASSVPRPE